jgi:hypothetical protein
VSFASRQKGTDVETNPAIASGTTVILTAPGPLAMLTIVQKAHKSGKRTRTPRIRVPNSERALFTVDTVHFVGVVRRLSLTGGSAVLAKGPIPHGTMGDLALNTIFGKVKAKIEFLQTGADGVPLAQAFRFLTMDDASSDRFTLAVRHMEQEGFSDALEEKSTGFGGAQSLNRLLDSVRRLAATLVAARSSARS